MALLFEIIFLISIYWGTEKPQLFTNCFVNYVEKRYMNTVNNIMINEWEYELENYILE